MTIRLVVALGGVSATSDNLYLDALRQAAPDADVVGLVPSASESAHEVVQGASGLVLTGGADVHPARYNEEPAGAEMKYVSVERDTMEAEALDEADRAGIPILAICRGMQMLNVHRGGGLLQDIGQSHRDGRPQNEKWRAFHEVEVEPATRLAAALGVQNAAVNSRHHQAVDPARVGRGLRAIGWCPADGTVEALQQDGDRFVLAVQWHPENMAFAPDDAPERIQARLFEAFAEAARQFAFEAVPD